MTTESKDLELFHFGVKGMRWGTTRKVGSDGLAEGKPPGPKKSGKNSTGGSESKGPGRVTRAKIQENENLIKLHTNVKNREGNKALKVLSAPDRALLGKKRFEKYHDTHIDAMTKQNDRLKSGKATVMDKLDVALNTSVYSIVKAR